jgi:PAS domain S-box-containing protein
MECVTDHALLLLDPEGRVADWNAGAERTFGYRADEIIGRPFADFFTPEDVAAGCPGRELRAAAELGRAADERWYVRKDGARLWCSGTLTALSHKDGALSGFAAVLHDQTERKRTEDALRESEERHRIITDLTSDYNYTCTIDADGVPHMETATEGFARITGYTLEEVQAAGDVPNLVHPEDWPAAMERLQSLLTGVANSNVLRIITKGGAVRWVRYMNKPVWDRDHTRVVRLVGAAQDITERVLAEEALRESRARLEVLSRQLLAVQETERRHLAHELHDEIGQTLTAIKLNLQAAQDAETADARARLGEAIAIVGQAVEKVRHLSLDLRPSVLDDLGLEAALRWYTDRQIRRTGLAIRLDTDLGGRRLPADLETACFRVAQEALTNVARHAHASRVWIELQQRGAAVELAVRDDGVGFDPGEARRRTAAGASFGLLGMRERVELLGGKFAADSQPGHGSSIRARFPVAHGPGDEPR